MSATSCSCGFQRLDDEEVTDHLLTVFEPEDSIGTDGQIHQEEAVLTCACGFAAPSAEELDAHFLALFTPADHIASDGQQHDPLD